MHADVVLRQAGMADAPGIWAVRYAVQENTLAPGRISDEDLRRALQDTGRGWVAERDGRILGFAIANAQDGNIWALFVHPDAQGQGLGHRLHQLMLDWLLAQPGTPRPWLGTGAGTQALGFYLRRGWQHDPAQPPLASGDLRLDWDGGPQVFEAEGGCDCRALRYRLLSRPLFTHCCHCRWCQRESGASFALNAMIEADRLQLLAGAPERVVTPSDSGAGQWIARCPQCRIALWSHYAGSGPAVAFVRVGTLDQPDRLPPDVHIFTASKQPWVSLSPDTPAVAEFYERERLWPAASLRRRQALLPAITAWQAGPRRWPA